MVAKDLLIGQLNLQRTRVANFEARAIMKDKDVDILVFQEPNIK